LSFIDYLIAHVLLHLMIPSYRVFMVNNPLNHSLPIILCLLQLSNELCFLWYGACLLSRSLIGRLLYLVIWSAILICSWLTHLSSIPPQEQEAALSCHATNDLLRTRGGTQRIVICFLCDRLCWLIHWLVTCSCLFTHHNLSFLHHLTNLASRCSSHHSYAGWYTSDLTVVVLICRVVFLQALSCLILPAQSLSAVGENESLLHRACINSKRRCMCLLM